MSEYMYICKYISLDMDYIFYSRENTFSADMCNFPSGCSDVFKNKLPLKGPVAHISYQGSIRAEIMAIIVECTVLIYGMSEWTKCQLSITINYI